ncbi:hypothetical protein [Enterobacter ludwigii]
MNKSVVGIQFIFISFSLMTDEQTPRRDSFMRDKSKVISMLMTYGFIEVSDIIFVLTLSRSSQLTATELYYLECKLNECLRSHDNGSDYFIPLRELKEEVVALKSKFETGMVERYLSRHKSGFNLLRRLREHFS